MPSEQANAEPTRYTLTTAEGKVIEATAGSFREKRFLPAEPFVAIWPWADSEESFALSLPGSYEKPAEAVAESRRFLEALGFRPVREGTDENGIESVPMDPAIQKRVCQILKERGFPEYQDCPKETPDG
jgi:hypothetical protein